MGKKSKKKNKKKKRLIPSKSILHSYLKSDGYHAFIAGERPSQSELDKILETDEDNLKTAQLSSTGIFDFLTTGQALLEFKGYLKSLIEFVNGLETEPFYFEGMEYYKVAHNEGNPGRQDHLVNVSPVPLPGAVWLFGSVLIGFLGYKKYRK